MNIALHEGQSPLSRYRLIDFGAGRKLEELGSYRIDRPSPAADGIARKMPELWRDAAAIYRVESKSWSYRLAWPNALKLDCGGFFMPVQPTPYGHIGLFPEQLSNWAWIRQRIADWLRREQSTLSAIHTDATLDESERADASNAWGLNLFGYTGASTLAMVSAGLAVSHVDAAKPNVQTCRLAAEMNGWDHAPIRYLVDDALKFAQREVRRRQRYRMIVLDPPAYGHSPRGKAWRLERDLWPLLDACIELVDGSFAMLVTGHSPQVDAGDVIDYLMASASFRRKTRTSSATGGHELQIESGRSFLEAETGMRLDTGFFTRFSL